MKYHLTLALIAAFGFASCPLTIAEFAESNISSDQVENNVGLFFSKTSSVTKGSNLRSQTAPNTISQAGGLSQNEEPPRKKGAKKSLSLGSRIAALEKIVLTQQTEIDNLRGKTTCIADNSNVDNLIFSGCNVHVVNGVASNKTATTNGKGNLIVGYNEGTDPDKEIVITRDKNDRLGSHNVVIGSIHAYNEHSGIVFGVANSIGKGSMSGGRFNVANGDWSSISGGELNAADGTSSSITGGSGNKASGATSSITGGENNNAKATHSSVSGGRQNTAGGDAPDLGMGSSISGGTGNKATGQDSSVSGGELNEASGPISSISGGASNVASGDSSSISGGFSNEASGEDSSISGGEDNEATGVRSSISGGIDNEASGDYSSISGGRNNIASGTYSTVIGGNGKDQNGDQVVECIAEDGICPASNTF